MSESNADNPNGKRGVRIAVFVAVLFAAYMGAYETLGYYRMGLFVGELPPRFFIGQWPIPSKIADPFFAPADWIDEMARQVWHLISG